MNQRRNKAIENLIRKYLEKGYVPQAVSASSLREVPGLTENEKYLLIKKRILHIWASFNEKDEEIKKTLENKANVAMYNTDALMNFAINNVKNIGFEEIAMLLQAFGAEDPEIALRYVILAKERGSPMLFYALQTISNTYAPEQAIDFVVEWAVENGLVDEAIKASDLRDKPGLIQIEVETLLANRIKNGDIIDSVILADMREPKATGLTATEIEDLAAAIR